MIKRVAITQPNYLPWKGYFDIVRDVDLMVHFDDVQYTTRDWRNRNRIKKPDGSAKWISVPVIGNRDQLICEARIDQTQNWAESHAGAIKHAYADAPHFDRYFEALIEILNRGHEYLTGLDADLTDLICGWLGLETEFAFASDLSNEGTRDDRLISVLKQVGAEEYVSGPSARDYIVPEKFADAGIHLVFFDYPDYPVYPQVSEPFMHEVSIIDLLFSVGPDAPNYIWGDRPAAARPDGD